MKKNFLKAVISTIMAVSLLQANASALVLPDGGLIAAGTTAQIEGWSSKGAHGQVYVVSELTKYNSANIFFKDSITHDAKITYPGGTKATKYVFLATIWYNNGTTETKNTEEKTEYDTNYSKITVKAGNQYANKGRGSTIMVLEGFGQFNGGTYIVF